MSSPPYNFGVFYSRTLALYCLWLSIHPMKEGGEPNDLLRVIKVLGVEAASQQTHFIVSGSPSNPILRGGDQIYFGC